MTKIEPASDEIATISMDDFKWANGGITTAMPSTTQLETIRRYSQTQITGENPISEGGSPEQEMLRCVLTRLECERGLSGAITDDLRARLDAEVAARKAAEKDRDEWEADRDLWFNRFDKANKEREAAEKRVKEFEAAFRRAALDTCIDCLRGAPLERVTDDPIAMDHFMHIWRDPKSNFVKRRYPCRSSNIHQQLALLTPPDAGDKEE